MRRKNEAIDEERGRWSSKKKMAAVLRLLKNKSLLLRYFSLIHVEPYPHSYPRSS